MQTMNKLYEMDAGLQNCSSRLYNGGLHLFYTVFLGANVDTGTNSERQAGRKT